MKKIFYSVVALCIALGAQAQVVDFENVETMEGDLTLNADNYQQNFFDEEEEEGLFMSGKFVFSNYYIAIMVCIFILVYYPVFYFITVRDRGALGCLRTTLKAVFASLLGIAMSAVMLLPTYISMQNAYYFSSEMPEEWSFYITSRRRCRRSGASITMFWMCSTSCFRQRT